MKSLIRFCCILALILVLSRCNNGPADSVKEVKKENNEKIDSQQKRIDSLASLPSKADVDFLVNAATGSMLKAQLGKLAQTNSKNPRVKHFGDMMIKEHAEASEKIKALAASKKL